MAPTAGASGARIARPWGPQQCLWGLIAEPAARGRDQGQQRTSRPGTASSPMRSLDARRGLDESSNTVNEPKLTPLAAFQCLLPNIWAKDRACFT